LTPFRRNLVVDEDERLAAVELQHLRRDDQLADAPAVSLVSRRDGGHDERRLLETDQVLSAL
jgi:hypothetical protein